MPALTASDWSIEATAMMAFLPFARAYCLKLQNGGSGEPFCYFNNILERVRANDKLAILVASSGLAALLLYKGSSTFHSRYSTRGKDAYVCSPLL
eukprot:1179465-Prorocentrum_minimum.AAC.11